MINLPFEPAPPDTVRGHIANALQALMMPEQVEAERIVYPSHFIGAVRAHLEQALGQLDGDEVIPQPIHLEGAGPASRVWPGHGAKSRAQADAPPAFLSDFAEPTNLGPTVDPIPAVGLG